MERLSDERVAAIVEWLALDDGTPEVCDRAGVSHRPTGGPLLESEVTDLAREVLELRQQVKELQQWDLREKARAGGLTRTKTQSPERLSEIGRMGAKARAARRRPAPPALGGDE